MIIILTKKWFIALVSVLLVLLLACGIYKYILIKNMRLNCAGLNQNEIESFLLKYGWHVDDGIYSQTAIVPLTYTDEPGCIPIGLYWAYNNELSKDIGKDLSLYKGKEITVYFVPLKENIGTNPNHNLRAEIIEYEGRIVGAWLGRGRHYSFECSLRRHYFADVTQKVWGEWLVDKELVDYNNGFDAETKNLSPEEVIRKHYEAIDKKDYNTACAYLSKAAQTHYLFANLDDNKIYHEIWDPQRWFENILQAKLTNLHLIENYRYNPNNNPPRNVLNRNIYDKVTYVVFVDMKYKQIITQCDGINQWAVTLVKETADAPWRIDAENTG